MNKSSSRRRSYRTTTRKTYFITWSWKRLRKNWFFALLLFFALTGFAALFS